MASLLPVRPRFCAQFGARDAGEVRQEASNSEVRAMAADANRRVGRGKASNRKAQRARPAQPTHPTVSVASQHVLTMASPATSSRGYSTYIGRVGALAVALGVGVLVTTGPGLSIARAQTCTDSSSTPSADGSPAAGSGGATGTATAPATADAPAPGPSNAP